MLTRPSPSDQTQETRTSKLLNYSNEPLHLFRHLRVPLLHLFRRLTTPLLPFLQLVQQEHHLMCSLLRATIFELSLLLQQLLRQHFRGCKLRGCRYLGCKLRGCRSLGRKLRGCWLQNSTHQSLQFQFHPPPPFRLLFPVLNRSPSTLQRVR